MLNVLGVAVNLQTMSVKQVTTAGGDLIRPYRLKKALTVREVKSVDVMYLS